MIYSDYALKNLKESATKIFYEKGFNGARVADIAKEAGVSKSLLHYYFRSKEQLFKVIMNDSIMLVVRKISPILTKDLSFYELIDQFVYNLLIVFKQNKCHLLFIINEFNQNYELIKSELQHLVILMKTFEDKLNELARKEHVPIKSTKLLIVHIISLCGWQIIGVNIFDKVSIKGKNSIDHNISDIRRDINETIVNMLKAM